jgi:tRNA-Thr(GGU) m(6)t(6)A37 methyltransferase TsaA
MNARHIELIAIGRVSSSVTDLHSAPRQPDEGAPEAALIFDEWTVEGLRNIQPGDEAILITWLDQAQRDVLTVRPRGDFRRALEGVFSTRSPDRPNPIGLHHVEIMAIEGCRLRVRGLDAVDGTPILDLKPVLAREIDRR